MSTFNESQHNRHSAGTSVGGQFANKDHPANDGVGLAVAERPQMETVQILDPKWPANTEVTFTRQDGGDWLVEAVTKTPVRKLVQQISAHQKVSPERVSKLLTKHREGFMAQFEDDRRYGGEANYLGSSALDAGLEGDYFVSRLSYRASDRRITEGDPTDPDFATEVLSFGTNRTERFIDLAGGEEAAENLCRAVDEDVLNQGTDIHRLKRGVTVTISDPNYPGEWVLTEPSTTDPASEHAEFLRQMRSDYGPNHPAKNVPAPEQVGEGFEWTEEERDAYLNDYESGALDPRHGALSLGFQRWWAVPAPSNPLAGSRSKAVAVSNLEMRLAGR